MKMELTKMKMKFICKYIIILPVLACILRLFAGRTDLNIKSALIVFISSTIGILLGLIYAEFLSYKITKYYNVISLIIGGTFMFVLITLMGFDTYAKFSLIPLGFMIFASNYKKNILDKTPRLT